LDLIRKIKNGFPIKKIGNDEEKNRKGILLQIGRSAKRETVPALASDNGGQANPNPQRVGSTPIPEELKKN
jgi:hypothetical protein